MKKLFIINSCLLMVSCNGYNDVMIKHLTNLENVVDMINDNKSIF